MRKIAVFDCCGTITKTNNTFHFINYVFNDRPVKKIIFKIMVFLQIFNIMNIIRDDLFRKCAIRLLKGYPISELRKKSEEYVKIIQSKNLLNDRILDLIYKEKLQKDQVLLISASINPTVEALAKELKIRDYFSSELEVIEGICTGKLRKDLLKDKEVIIQQYFKDIDFQNSSFYSDNLEDADVGAKFGNFVVVINSLREEKIWKNESKSRKIGYFLHNFDATLGYDSSDEVGSVNKKNKNRAYIPTLYYFMSRKIYSFVILLESILPYWFIVFFMTELRLWKSLEITFLSYFLFYSFYEIGSLFNDLSAKKEDEYHSTLRIAEDTKINFALFLLLRMFVAPLLLFYLIYTGYNILFFILGMALCLFISSVHTLIKGNLRILTFVMLKISTNLTPLLFLIGKMEIIYVFLAFFINTAPNTIFHYTSKKLKKKCISYDMRYRFCYLVTMILVGVLIYLFTSKLIYIILPIYLFIAKLAGLAFFKSVKQYEF